MAIEDVIETESPRSVVCPCGQILTSAHEAGVHIAVMHGAPFSAHILADFMWSQSAYTEYCQILKDFDLHLNIMKKQKKEIEERKEEMKKGRKEERKKRRKKERKIVRMHERIKDIYEISFFISTSATLLLKRHMAQS